MNILKNKINDPMLGSESHMGGNLLQFQGKEELFSFSF